MLLNILAVATLLSSVSATPTPQTSLLPPPLEQDNLWLVTNFTAACADLVNDDNCGWTFDIKGDEKKGFNPDVPRFAARCETFGYKYTSDQGGPDVPCTTILTDGGAIPKNVTAGLFRNPRGAGSGTSLSFRVTYSFSPNKADTFKFMGRATATLTAADPSANRFNISTFAFDKVSGSGQ